MAQSRSKILIKRSLNVRKIKFIYLVSQNSPFYNLSFSTMQIKAGNELRISNNLINFIAISKILFTRQSLSTPITLSTISVDLKSTPTETLASSETGHSGFSISQFIISSNTLISAVVISLETKITCPNLTYFSTISSKC